MVGRGVPCKSSKTVWDNFACPDWVERLESGLGRSCPICPSTKERVGRAEQSSISAPAGPAGQWAEAAGAWFRHIVRASYEVPVHADIPHQEVIFLDETDPISSPMKAKRGVGESLHIPRARRSGRQRRTTTPHWRAGVREYPITLDKLLVGCPRWRRLVCRFTVSANFDWRILAPLVAACSRRP